jgi:hypothetical protein
MWIAVIVLRAGFPEMELAIALAIIAASFSRAVLDPDANLLLMSVTVSARFVACSREYHILDFWQRSPDRIGFGRDLLNRFSA